MATNKSELVIRKGQPVLRQIQGTILNDFGSEILQLNVLIR